VGLGVFFCYWDYGAGSGFSKGEGLRVREGVDLSVKLCNPCGRLFELRVDFLQFGVEIVDLVFC
jgi:hypothetical protein